MPNKYVLISMDDERAGKIANALASKTCKKLLDALSEKEMSEKDIADRLHLPINTIEYNLKKLLYAELVEKTKTFFWSAKGKKIPTYKLSNKSIIISPKKKISSMAKTVLPVVAISAFATFLLKKITQIPVREEQFVMKTSLDSAEMALASPTTGSVFSSIPNEAWFFIGSCFAIVLFVLLSLRKLKGSGTSNQTLSYLKGGKD